MLDRNDDRTITANVSEVLEALYANLKEHNEILAEAREGYAVECKVALMEAQGKISRRLAKLDAGEVVDMEHIAFVLSPPQSHEREFITAIKMLEMHQSATDTPAKRATYEMKAIDVQRFVLNDWAWMNSFLVGTSTYSAKGREIAREKGLL